jgi:hypothetical protein
VSGLLWLWFLGSSEAPVFLEVIDTVTTAVADHELEIEITRQTSATSSVGAESCSA